MALPPASAPSSLDLIQGYVDSDTEESDEGKAAANPSLGSSSAGETIEQWTYWSHDTSSAKSTPTMLQFNTLSDFWSHVEDMKETNKMPVGTNCCCFKSSLELQDTYGGGVFKSAYFERGGSGSTWVETVQALMQEEYEDGNQILGAVLIVSETRETISLLTNSAADKTSLLNIGDQWKKTLDTEKSLSFIAHGAYEGPDPEEVQELMMHNRTYCAEIAHSLSTKKGKRLSSDFAGG